MASRVPSGVVDWSLLVAVVVLLATGLASLFVGVAGDWWLVAAHGVAGLVLVPLVEVKLWRVRHRVGLAGRSRTVAVSVLLAGLTVAALLTGVAWVFGVGLRVGPFPPLVVHAGLGLLVAPLLLVHLRKRFHAPAAGSLRDRRTAVQYGGLLVAGALTWRAQAAVNRVRDVAPRRFTGSREDGSDDGNAFPVTSWVADDPDPVDPGTWTLSIEGLVETPLSLAHGDLPTDAAGTRAILDCTSGWYSEHDWRGVRVGDLLDAAGAREGASWVTFHSVTGYRWSLPVGEARDALLATHVDGERLTHGHGFPLRLVAPGRRGFQWVKWVDAVEIRRRRDRSEWVAVFVSGL